MSRSNIAHGSVSRSKATKSVRGSWRHEKRLAAKKDRRVMDETLRSMLSGDEDGRFRATSDRIAWKMS